MDYSLSDEDVVKLGGPGTRMFTYPQLDNMKTISELIDDKYPNAIILYQLQSNGGSVYGHWCALKRLSPNTICFFDSYGNMIDNQLKFIQLPYRVNSNQFFAKLSNLLGASQYKTIMYNEHRYQRTDPKVTTCGRHAGFFCRMPFLDTDQYFDFMEKNKRFFKDKNYDDLIVRLTDGLF